MARFSIQSRYLLESRPLCIGIILHAYSRRARTYTCIYRAFSESLTNEASLQSLPRTRCTRASVSDVRFARSARFTLARETFRPMVVSQWKRSYGKVLNIIDIVQPTDRASLFEHLFSIAFVSIFTVFTRSNRTNQTILR